MATGAIASLSSGCRGDDDTFDNVDRRSSGGASGVAGSAAGGTAAGGGASPIGGSSGNASGGIGGMPMAGTGGATAGGGGAMAGNAGTASSAGMGVGGDHGMAGDHGMGGDDGMAGDDGMGGDDGTGGEGGAGQSGQGGQGGQGGSPEATCASANLSITLISATPNQQHDHLPIDGAARTTLLASINSGTPLTFTLPVEGSNPHDHTLTFTPEQLTTLRNGGTVPMITSSTSGPSSNLHTHTYSLECAP